MANMDGTLINQQEPDKDKATDQNFYKKKKLNKFRRQAEQKQDVMGLKDSTIQPVFYDSTSESKKTKNENVTRTKGIKKKLPPKNVENKKHNEDETEIA